MERKTYYLDCSVRNIDAIAALHRFFPDESIDVNTNASIAENCIQVKVPYTITPYFNNLLTAS